MDHVTSVIEPQGLRDAVVVIAGTSWKADTTDSNGRFEFLQVPAGHYAITVRRIGYVSTRDSIIVPNAVGLRLDAALEVRAFDGACSGYGAIPVRKPWWKFW